MKSRIINVFYDENGYPFKDQERSVRFPIVGSGFMGASNTTQIKFYFKEIGDDAVKYVAVSKLPNGKVGSKVLENYYDSELDEPYALLELDSYYTQYKGDLFISLQGYQGGVQVTYDEDTELYEIEGTPTIQATGSIKFTNNYATQFVGSGEEQNITLQQLLAIISDTVLRYYVNSSNTLAEVFNEIGTKICAIDIEGDEYLCEMSGDTNIVIYDIHNQEWYAFSGANTTTIDTVLNDQYKHTIASKEYVDENVLEMTMSPMTLTQDQVDYLIKNNARIKYDGFLFEHAYIDNDNDHVYICTYMPVVISSNTAIAFPFVVLTPANMTLTHNFNHLQIYNQEQADTLFATKQELANFGNLFTYKGTASVSEINALTNIGNGWCYNLTDSGTLTLGNLQVETGDNVAFNGTIWTKLSSETILGQYYTKQEGQAFESDIDNRVTNVENEVSVLASGSPKGVYDDVTALTTAFPEGNDNIYVCLDTGDWYYWNGTQWASGGDYLSSLPDAKLNPLSTNSIQNKAITDLFDIDYGLNLYDFENRYLGYITTNGTGAESASYITSDYIPVKPGQVIITQSPINAQAEMRWVSAYDENKNVIAASGATDVSSYTVPNGVYFIRVCCLANRLNSLSMILADNTLPKLYVPYHEPRYILKENHIKDDILETTELLNNFEKVNGTNLLNKNDVKTGVYIATTGSYEENPSYNTSNLIPVKPGQVLSIWNGDTPTNMRFVCALDENLTAIPSSGQGTEEQTYTVPDGIAYVKITFYSSASLDTLMIIVGTTYPGSYYSYINPYYVLKGNQVSIDDLNFAKLQNLFDVATNQLTENKFLWQGSLSDNNAYNTIDYVEVSPNTTYSVCAKYHHEARTLEEYDSSKSLVSGTSKTYVNTFTTSSTTKYIRGSFYKGDIQTLTIIEGNEPLSSLPHKKLIDGSLIAPNRELLAFLPKEIYCVVGQTIEIYNDQVMPSASKYHFNYYCNVGKALNRKFTVTGTNNNVGEYSLVLEIYDDNEYMLYSLKSTLKIVAALSTQKSICPIGDSLTNGKYWLKYVNDDLSNGNIQYVGTRGSVAGRKNEGRSGWTAAKYLSSNEYDYEQPATPNPFYSSSLGRFSWSYYKSTYSINPDAVQIWLGTNDLLGTTKEQFATNIKQMITYIRQDDATIPIFICLTILPAEQNGIGTQTSTDGFASATGMWQYHWWNTIISGVKYLENELLALNDSNLHIIPLVCSHDSKYNFGVVETNVNPHITTVKEPMPVEGVHPQQPGYEQIGDILYSCYCAKLGS